MINWFSISMIQFAMVGVVGMLIDFAITWVLREKINAPQILASVIGFSFAVINNFFLNWHWTFKHTNMPSTAYGLRFLIVSLAGLLLHALIMKLMLRVTKLNFYLLKCIAIAVVFSWNYFVNIQFTFL